MTRTGSLTVALANGRRLLATNPGGAAEQAAEILGISPGQPDALSLYGAALRALGRIPDAEATEKASIDASLRLPTIRNAAQALSAGRLAEAEGLLRSRLANAPEDVIANVMLADIAARIGINEEAEKRLRYACALAPAYVDAQVNLAMVLFQQKRRDECIALLDAAIAREPDHLRAAVSKVTVLVQTGEYDAAAACYEALLQRSGTSPNVWMWYGHLLKTMGRQQDAIHSYRRATTLDPDLAEGWWSLSNMKANQLGADDIAAMQCALDRLAGKDAQCLHLHFALGKAFEDSRQWALSFDHYAAGNALRLRGAPHDREGLATEVDQSIALFDRHFFAARAGSGDPAPDPIFVIGMPRAGSTLIEQILSSHPQIEGTSELPDIPQLALGLIADRWRDDQATYPAVTGSLPPAAFADLGRKYLQAAAHHRKTARPFFIDKLPNNWLYIGFIHLILPNARIVDARREPMACCFSNFKQHFARGQNFAYSLTDLGSYYRDYVRLTAHFDEVLPGLIHRVQHEDLLAEPEAEIRRLVDYLGLPFDPACLRFHENARPVRTASSEQVRRPLNRDAVDLWKSYDPWLDDLKAALGPLAPG